MSKNKALNDETKNTKLRGIRAIIHYFQSENWTRAFPIKLFTIDEKPYQIYAGTEVENLLVKPNIKQCSFDEYRSWVIVNFLMAAGVRSRTLIDIRIKDINFESNLILCHTTKNHQLLVIPLSKDLKSVLREYLEYRKGNEEDFLFITSYGEQLSRSTAFHSTEDYANRRAVDTTGIHRFWHTFGTTYIANGGNRKKLKGILGHHSDVVVSKYVHLSGVELKKRF